MATNSGESGALLVEGKSSRAGSPAPPISFPMANLGQSGLPKTPLQQVKWADGGAVGEMMQSS